VLAFGFALNGACHAHVTAPSQAQQANEPVGELQRPVGIYPIGRAEPGPIEDSSPTISYSTHSTLQVVGKEIREAIQSCNTPMLKRTILSYAEFDSLVAKRVHDEAAYAAMVGGWLGAAAGEYCASGRPGRALPIGEAMTGDTVVVPAGNEWKRPLLVSRMTFRCVDSTPPGAVVNDGDPITLVKFNGVWRILLIVPGR
jgi:hypothetical protein